MKKRRTEDILIYTKCIFDYRLYLHNSHVLYLYRSYDSARSSMPIRIGFGRECHKKEVNDIN